jgi:signal transduction histidine kinase
VQRRESGHGKVLQVLHAFLVATRGEILSRARAKLAAREIPAPTTSELANGLPLFLDQLIGLLAQKKEDRDAGHRDVATSASLRGGELWRMGLSVGQVVQDYGSLCQSVTEIAAERAVTISADEFQTFNRCLDDATAQAVTSYEQQRDRMAGSSATEELRSMVHEMRNMVTTSMLTFDALKRGTIGIQGSTSALLGNSLRRMRVLLDRTIADVRVGAGKQILERVAVVELIEEIEIVATMEATDHDISLSIDGGPVDVSVEVDRQILVSALANLVQNAVKFTRPRGHVSIRAHTSGERALIDVDDECGGLPPGDAEELFLPFEQRGADKSGLGLGLPISLRGVRASGGEIRVRDRPGIGCTFTIDLPNASPLPATR